MPLLTTWSIDTSALLSVTPPFWFRRKTLKRAAMVRYTFLLTCNLSMLLTVRTSSNASYCKSPWIRRTTRPSLLLSSSKISLNLLSPSTLHLLPALLLPAFLSNLITPYARIPSNTSSTLSSRPIYSPRLPPPRRWINLHSLWSRLPCSKSCLIRYLHLPPTARHQIRDTRTTATSRAAYGPRKTWNALYLGKIVGTGRLRSIMVVPIRQLHAISPYSVIRNTYILFCYRFVYNVS
jgi:hypothetical protein